jgi:hypothetical protein
MILLLLLHYLLGLYTCGCSCCRPWGRERTRLLGDLLLLLRQLSLPLCLLLLLVAAAGLQVWLWAWMMVLFLILCQVDHNRAGADAAASPFGSCWLLLAPVALQCAI